MAARLTKGTKDVPWSEQTRLRIKTSMLLNRLHDHIFNAAEMSATQLRATEILLKKTCPDLTAIEHSGEMQTSYVLRAPLPAKQADEWQIENAPTIQ